MSPPIFDPITFNQLPHLMNTKNPPCLNGDKVELATNLLRVFNHKHRFAIVNKLPAFPPNGLKELSSTNCLTKVEWIPPDWQLPFVYRNLIFWSICKYFSVRAWYIP